MKCRYILKWGVSHSVVSDSLQPHRLGLARPFCPRRSPGKSTRVGCHSLLQGIFLTQGSNPGLLHCRHTLYHLSHQGISWYILWHLIFFSPHYVNIHKKQKLWLDITIAIETNSLATIFQHLGETHTPLYGTSMWPHPQLRWPHRARQAAQDCCLSLCASISGMQKWDIWHPPPHAHSKETACYAIQNDFGSPLTFISIDSFSKIKV